MLERSAHHIADNSHVLSSHQGWRICRRHRATATARPPQRVPCRIHPACSPRTVFPPLRSATEGSVLTAADTLPDAIAKVAAGLPIAEVLSEVLTVLKGNPALVLQADPGAGKTTVVPLALLLSRPDWLSGGKRILVRDKYPLARSNITCRLADVVNGDLSGPIQMLPMNAVYSVTIAPLYIPESFKICMNADVACTLRF